MVRIQHFQCQGPGSIPGGEMKILQDMQHNPLARKKKKKKKPFRRENRVKLGNSRMDKWVDIEIYATQTREIFSYKQNFLTQKWLLQKLISLPSLKLFKWIRYSLDENVLEI